MAERLHDMLRDCASRAPTGFAFAEPRPELRDLPPAVHGGDAPAGTIDLSTGVSPLPPPPAVLAAARAADLTRYPHPTALPLRQVLAAAHGVEPDAIVAGAGSVELIWALARTFGGPGRRVAWLAPAFAEYGQAARASGAAALAVDGPLSDVPAGVDLIFAARPGNPTLATPAIAARPGALVVVDEAYQPLCDDVPPLAPAPGIALLRSLTKLFALPGLRLGYLVAEPRVARAVQAALPPWNVSQPASAAGLAALAEPTAPVDVRAAIAALRRRLVAGLTARGARIVAANGTFVVVDVGDAARAAARLAAAGVRVRDCTSFGLPALVRIGVGAEPAQDRLFAAWETLA